MDNKEIIFTVWWETPETLLKISPDWFFYKWERVEDINKIYERFTEWMTKAELVDKNAEET